MSSNIYLPSFELVSADSSPEYTPTPSRAKSKGKGSDNDKFNSLSSDKHGGKSVGKYTSLNDKFGNGYTHNGRENSDNVGVRGDPDTVRVRGNTDYARFRDSSEEPSSQSAEDTSDEQYTVHKQRVNGTTHSIPKTSGKAQLEKPPPGKPSSTMIQVSSLALKI